MDWKIGEIEALGYWVVKLWRDAEWVDVKGHEVAFVDLGGRFGYSALVFGMGPAGMAHLYHANDYELHHEGLSREELRELYMRKLNHVLFTEDELREPSNDYVEQKRKLEYLMNHHSMKCPHVSFWHCGELTERDREIMEAGIKSYIGCAWYAACHEDFVEHMDELAEAVDDATVRDYDYWLGAFKYEMGNHEYHINWQGDWDVVSCFFKVEYGEEKGGLTYLREAGCDDEVLRAYQQARDEFMRECDEKGW